MIEIWGARDVQGQEMYRGKRCTGARDVQGQLDGVARNKSVYLRIETAMTNLGWAKPAAV